MRILMLNNEFPPLGGGMGTVNLALFKQFAPNPDLEIDLITSAINGAQEFEQFSDKIRIFKVPVWNQNIHHSSNRELTLFAALALFKAHKLHKDNGYDFCFSWSSVPAGAVALALFNIVDLPYMVRVSGPDIPGFEPRYRHLYLLLTPLLRSIWRNAAPLIAKCQEEVAMIQAVDPNVKVKIIPNGVDLSGFYPGPPIPDQGPLRILCSARLIERKGQHHLILAVKKLAEEGVYVNVDLLGTGDSLAEFQKLAQKYCVDDRVHFLGYIPREEIPKYYTQAHVFVLPSQNEGMSLAALEAMAAGMPLVVTRTGGVKSLVEEGVNGFTLDWADVNTLARHINRLSEGRSLARHMGKASRERAEKFKWDAVARKYLELFVDTQLQHEDRLFY
jgi:glycosyltransferase involved in cell wall biosynthesis